MIPHIVAEDSIMVMIDGVTHVVSKDETSKYNDVKNCLIERRFDDIKDIFNFSKKIKEYCDGKITIEDGVLKYNGMYINNSLTSRIIKMNSEGFDINPMILFLNNLMKNPSKQSVDELYGFLSKNSLPITEDGYFLAYKKIRGDWKDNYTGTMDNSIGKIVSMPRNFVDDQRENVCSTGLHFCSMNYLPSYGGSIEPNLDGSKSFRVVVVKINPADVVSIPTDYNNAKGRCCKYEVIQEVNNLAEDFFTKSVYSKDDFSEDEDCIDDEDEDGYRSSSPINEDEDDYDYDDDLDNCR